MKSGMNGAEVDYVFVKDFCIKEDLEPIDIYGLFRQMVGVMSAKK